MVVKYNNTTGNAGISYNNSAARALTCPSPEALGPFLVGGGTQGFNGYIDDIYIYNRVLTSTEITTIRGASGTLDIPTSVTPTHTIPIVRRAVQGKAMYTIAGRQATKTRGILVSKGVARLVVR
jgi:hypothetical protein